jgi:hypothetical protein
MAPADRARQDSTGFIHKKELKRYVLYTAVFLHKETLLRPPKGASMDSLDAQAQTKWAGSEKPVNATCNAGTGVIGGYSSGIHDKKSVKSIFTTGKNEGLNAMC